MTITPALLLRAAGAAAVGAGLVFIGVQIGHPHLDATTVATTEMTVRNTLKVLMAVLGLVGITGMYLRQVRDIGVLGLVGYLLAGTGYLAMMAVAFVGAYVLPSLVATDPGYVDDVLASVVRGTATGRIGLLDTAVQVQGIAYLAGGLVFGIALYRARVLARWAAALLAVGGVVTVALSVLPDAFYRLLAYPNGIAMVGLGLSLWFSVRAPEPQPAAAGHRPLTPAGGE